MQLRVDPLQAEQRGRRRAGHVVRVGDVDQQGVGGGALVAGVVGDRVSVVTAPVVGVDAYVLVRVADDAQPVGDRVEVDAEVGAGQAVNGSVASAGSAESAAFSVAAPVRASIV